MLRHLVARSAPFPSTSKNPSKRCSRRRACCAALGWHELRRSRAQAAAPLWGGTKRIVPECEQQFRSTRVPWEHRKPQEPPEGSQESPKIHRGATKSTRSEAKRVPKSTQKEAKRAIESSKAKCVKKPEMSEVKIVLPPRRGHDFRCQRRGEGRAYFRVIFGARMVSLEIPWVLRSAHKTLTMKKSICLETIDCFSYRLISVKPLRVGRFTPCEPASGRL